MCLIAACTSTPAPEQTTSGIDSAELAVQSGVFDSVCCDGVEWITGPEALLRLIKMDALEGKRRLEGYLESDKKHVQYFAIIALAQIGDAESRRILFNWARQHEKDRKDLAVIVAIRLIWMNDFRLLEILSRADAASNFQMGTLFPMARVKLGMLDVYGTNNPKENGRHLKRIIEFLLEIPPEIRDVLR